MTQNYAENQTIAGYFDNHESAQRALEELRDAGFTSAHLGVAHRGGSSSAGRDESLTGRTEKHAAGMWDKVKNFFEGGVEPYADERTRGDMATREITNDPGTGSEYGQDDLHHSLTGLSVPEDRSRYLGNRFRQGENGAVVTVNAGSRAADAERILRDNGADLGDNTAAYPSQVAGESQGYTGSQGAGETQGLQNIQLLGEVLRVHKDRLNRGEVRIRKEVVTETQTVQVPVTREELVLERRPVNGDTQANGTVGEGQEVRIPLTEETASVDKGTVVREEITVGKKPVSDVRDLSGEVRHEELVVEGDTNTRKRAVNE
jgi:uncharacterized protein (TIGR02271 family)